MKQVDKLIGQKQKILNKQKGMKFVDMPQWAQDRIVYFDRKINRLKCKKDDIILDLHNRLAFELVSRYDVIFLPTFETRGNQGKPGETRGNQGNGDKERQKGSHHSPKYLPSDARPQPLWF